MLDNTTRRVNHKRAIDSRLTKNQKQEENEVSKVDEYCNKLIIQINGILKEIAVGNFEFSPEKIAKITQETTGKYKDLISQ